ncbi:MAG TPA: methylmalonyl Co-A mutase-associated GTPase MeaB [Acidimicrobiales bacterium]|jgi:LAO/AO transport system kinase|nr:methylmalonyl Co-A mutase-associated GTPase MeaB [Acidimicrobiales bacterium]
MTAPRPSQLLERLQRGEEAALARLLTLVEEGGDEAAAVIGALGASEARSHVVGVTGPPGSGKSTLVGRLVAEYRRRGARVGVLAIDPSSQRTGGALLGDRLRMASVADDREVFIRSMATRGALGGLARATADAVAVLAAAGRSVVIIETVGVGQTEMDVVEAAQTVAVVSVPGLGDGVQAMKSGLLEVADVHVVNMADREGASRTAADLREAVHASARRDDGWEVPVLLTDALHGEGVDALVETLDAHRAAIAASGELDRRVRRNAEARIRRAGEELVRALLAGRTGAELVDAVAAGDLDPASAVRALLAGAAGRDPLLGHAPVARSRLPASGAAAEEWRRQSAP